MTWINEEIMLKEISQIQKYDYYINSLTGGSRIVKLIETESQMVIPRD